MNRVFALRARTGVGLFLVALATGCGGEVKLVPAEGTLKVDGKPAANMAIQFMPDSLQGAKGPTSVGTTDAEGKFRLKTIDGRDGAVPGPHTVVLTDLDEDRPPQGKPPTKLPRIDSKYNTASGGLKVEVPASGGEIPLSVPGRGR